MFSEEATEYKRPIPDWVPEKIRNRVISGGNGDEWKRKIRKEISLALGIEENLKHVETEKVIRFYDQITGSIMEAAIELSLPFPEIRLSNGWETYQDQKRKNKIPKYSAYVASNEYNIWFSPEWIEDILEDSPFVQKIDVDLIVRHEMLHLWQNVHEPERIENLSNKLNLLEGEQPQNFDIVRRFLTDNELEAIKYEFRTLKREEGVDSLRKYLYKSLLLLFMKYQIIQRERQKKKLKIDF